METRMDKYYGDDINEFERTKKNERLYRSVSDEISSLDNLPVPDTSKEIDMDGLKEIISSRGDYRIQKQLEKTASYNLEELKNTRINKNKEEEKVYDINVLIENAKNEVNSSQSNTKEFKKNIPSNFLSDMKEDIPNSEDAIVISKEEIKKDDNMNTDSLPLDELMNLKGNDNTIVTDPIVKEEVTMIEEIKEDEAFYSGSLHFNKKDFEEDEDFNIEKSHDGLKIFFLVFGIILLIAVIALIIYKYVI